MQEKIFEAIIESLKTHCHNNGEECHYFAVDRDNEIKPYYDCESPFILIVGQNDDGFVSFICYGITQSEMQSELPNEIESFLENFFEID